jgi:hypothetical protein
MWTSRTIVLKVPHGAAPNDGYLPLGDIPQL